MFDKLKEKLSLRNLLLCFSAVMALVAFIIMMVVSTTGYFDGGKPNAAVLVLSLLFIGGCVVFILFDDKIGKWDTIYLVLLGVCIILSLVLFILDKEEVVGEMMIPVNHPTKQVDAANTVITSVVFYSISMISFMVASFLDGKKTEIKKA